MVEKKTILSKETKIQVGKVEIGAHLVVPPDAKGIVLFAHGSGSGRKSPRNQLVAKFLQDENIATLLLDLLTMEEEEEDNITRELRFNIPFLSDRLTLATDWVLKQKELSHLTVGYFGASTGAAAALIAASKRRDIRAVVSRGGRPDLAGNALPKVSGATLFIVGGDDFGVIELNQKAYALLSCEKRLEIVPHATHLFEEPGALERVGHLASAWFSRYF